MFRWAEAWQKCYFWSQRYPHQKDLLKEKNSEVGTVCYGQVGTWKKWKKSVKKGPSSHPIADHPGYVQGDQYRCWSHGFFWQWLLVETKRQGVTLVDFHGRPTNLPRLRWGSTGVSTMGFWMVFPPKKRGIPKMDLKFKKLCGNGNWSWKKDKFIRNQKTPLFFLKRKPSFGRCAWAYHTTWSTWSSRCDIFEEVSILGARFIGFSEKHREKLQWLLGVYHFEIDISLMESFFRGLSDLLRSRRHDDCWKCWLLSRISLLDVLSFC